MTDDSRVAGRAALDRGAWDEARLHLQTSIASGETPEALEDLGLAAWWLDDQALTFDARERAYSLYRDRGNTRAAARVALWQVWDNLAFRGDFAVASGWLERARRLLASDQQSAEYGWLLIRQGDVALFRGHDPAAAIENAALAAKLGRDIGDPSVEFTALALEGLALVSTGDVLGGLRRLDEASLAATSGEMKQLHAVGLVCCWQLFACERVRDYERATQWCSRVNEFTRRWGLGPLSAVCRTQYAGVLIWRGDWAGAEAELTSATRDLEQSRPALMGAAFARLGELRLRQGRFDDAARLFEQSSSELQSRVGTAALLLERGDADGSAALLSELLAQLAPAEATVRAGVLEALVCTHAARNDLEAAQPYLEELQRIGSTLRSDPLLASVAAATGIVLHRRGELADAMRCFETAVELFQKTGAPFETAHNRLRLAELLAQTGRADLAERQARLAAQQLDALGAYGDAQRATRLLRALGRETEKRAGFSSLTTRQIEILRLIAQGMSNVEIAARLSVSAHTVKRHVANLLNKLGLSSRAAAVAHAAREGLL
jgi:LuxR family maltose regulon positive regulatory protein